MCAAQMQASMEAQHEQHAAQVAGMSKEAEQLQSLVRQLTEQDQQRLTELEGHKADAGDLRQVHSQSSRSSFSGMHCRDTEQGKDIADFAQPTRLITSNLAQLCSWHAKHWLASA